MTSKITTTHVISDSDRNDHIEVAPDAELPDVVTIGWRDQNDGLNGTISMSEEQARLLGKLLLKEYGTAEDFNG